MESSPPPSTIVLFEEYLDQLLVGAAPPLAQFLDRHPALEIQQRERLEKLTCALGGAPARGARRGSGLPFERLGGFRLVRELGAGGMGVVYLAVQETLAREVALKVLRPESWLSPEASARFEREAKAVAKLHHDGIVTVFEAGSDHEVSYLAMEFVPGEGLNERLAQLRARNVRMPVRECLALARQIALALHAAHEAGIVHRDVKPSNVRITLDGRAKLLDFGLALDADSAPISRTGQVHGTLHYVSPEQIEGASKELDGRSDVWSLGVTLYECLTGVVPFRGASSPEILRQILEEEPIAPRRLEPGISREVEIVVLNALEKQRERRYASAKALAEDLEAILELRPIRARATGPMTRAWKWTRRKPGHASAAVLTALLLVGVPSLHAAVQTRHAFVLAKEKEQVKEQSLIAEARRKEAEHAQARAEEQQQLAEQRADETREVARFQTRMLSELSIDALGRTIVDELEVDLGQNLARQGFSQDEIERAQATLKETLRPGNPTNVAQRALEEALFEPALRAIEEGYSGRPLLAATLQSPLAETLHALALFEPAERAARAAVATRRAHLGDGDPLTLASISTLATVLKVQEKHTEAEELFREALAGYRAHFGEDHPYTLIAVNGLAVALLAQGRLSEAEPLFHAAVAGLRTQLGDRDPETLKSINSYGALYLLQGNAIEAEPLCREALEGLRTELGAENPHTLVALNNLAEVLEAQGRLNEAEPLYREALAISRATLGDDHSDTLISIGNFGGLLWSQGKLAEAESLCREKLAGCRAKFGDGNPETYLAQNELAQVLKDRGELGEAESLSRVALEGLRATLGEQHSQTLIALNNLAALLYAQGRPVEAEAVGREALAGWRATLGDLHPSSLNSMSNLAAILARQGQLSEAEELCREALAGSRETLGHDHPRTLTALNNLAEVLRAQGEPAEALPLFREAHTGFRALFGGEHPSTQQCLRSLIQVLERLHALDPADGLDLELEELRALSGK